MTFMKSNIYILLVLLTGLKSITVEGAAQPRTSWQQQMEALAAAEHQRLGAQSPARVARGAVQLIGKYLKTQKITIENMSQHAYGAEISVSEINPHIVPNGMVELAKRAVWEGKLSTGQFTNPQYPETAEIEITPTMPLHIRFSFNNESTVKELYLMPEQLDQVTKILITSYPDDAVELERIAGQQRETIKLLRDNPWQQSDHAIIAAVKAGLISGAFKPEELLTKKRITISSPDIVVVSFTELIPVSSPSGIRLKDKVILNRRTIGPEPHSQDAEILINLGLPLRMSMYSTNNRYLGSLKIMPAQLVHLQTIICHDQSYDLPGVPGYVELIDENGIATRIPLLWLKK